ncbi:MAG TPA: Bax inhibitor-1/YccA family protein [Povalibacter sp.]|uniref:Bax inhibitor-1/YccA family protein n=1 Tax=Povalibacter sp. TaxID=1962978 RepID=UPI002C7BD739|nr:Bax inhibitor-1/YccA family protein [Povalibacter sp.]HMN46654.1 Bax inhibitor-1/YccA family protein [Povalibacter sp.]
MQTYPAQVGSATQSSALSTNKVLRNTYLLLGATLAFSAAMAGVSMALNLPSFGLLTILVYFGLLFAVTKTQNSSWGILWTFALTGFLGLTLGPILNMYLKFLPNGGQIIMLSLGTTAAAFVGLSAYAVKSGRDFSFMGGFLMIGAIGAFVLGLVAYFFNLPTLSLVVSAMFLIVSGGLMLWQTSEIVRGGETNYISATITLYVSIYNMFLSLLNLFGAASGDD